LNHTDLDEYTNAPFLIELYLSALKKKISFHLMANKQFQTLEEYMQEAIFVDQVFRRKEMENDQK